MFKCYNLYFQFFVAASTNLVGKFTQSVRRIVQDVKDEGTASNFIIFNTYFIKITIRQSLKSFFSKIDHSCICLATRIIYLMHLIGLHNILIIV